MMHEEPVSSRAANRNLVLGILVLAAAFGFTAYKGWPQAATQAGLDHAADAQHDDPKEVHAPPPLYMLAPFVILLGCIAVLPLVPACAHWWESNLHRFYVAAGLGLLTLLYYLLVHGAPIERHFISHAQIPPAASGPSFALVGTVLQNAILSEYVPFIALLLALYTICGGIRIEGDLAAHPSTNAMFLLVGAALASIIGTTGAAMLLIRPLLETNNERKFVTHTVVFFIFVVCNCGGLLLPLGDPPLFLGYLHGVDFLWTLKMLWLPWCIVNGLLIATYYLWDRLFCYPKEAALDIAVDETRVRGIQVTGLWPNGVLLLGVVLAVALLDPSKPVPGTQWHAWLFLREMLMLGLIGLSLLLGKTEIRDKNKFTYAAIIEVAALFFGIFVCMQPALQILEANGAKLGVDTPKEFFWASGSLSSVLDNAPTYLVFFETAKSLHLQGVPTEAGVPVALLVGVSLGSVFMGAMTYIGNGPNFMVKAIAEQSKVKMPSFFGYVVYSCGVLLPILLLMTMWVL